MRNFFYIVVLAAAVGACASDANQNRTVTINLSAQNDSGENGTATLTSEGNKTKVVIALSNASADVAQPAHIHAGSCANINPKPKYPLNAVKNGTSTTIVAAELSSLVSGGNAINVHKSPQEIKTYVACGDIK